ncbi:MAG: prepilin-type N-terminal cleavage/methylation domain-containing protein [Planctomycetota bacterium]|jgi:prepilin-type N-terminal cleavage/methylation domain-containing protein
MSCSKKIAFSALPKRNGFSLPEVMAALTILAFVSASVVVVISRCVSSAADTTLRLQALEVARDNMERLLAADSLEAKSEYGTSEKYPEIQWQTVVQAFYEPITSRMWIEGICSAEYTDTEGETQTVEFTHWLTDLTKQQVKKMLQEEEKAQEQLSEQVLETVEEAAEYAGVDEETIEQWVESGMPTTRQGYYIKPYITLYQDCGGNPPPEARQEFDEVYGPFIWGGPMVGLAPDGTPGSKGPGGTTPRAGGKPSPTGGRPSTPGAGAPGPTPSGPSGPIPPTGQPDNPWRGIDISKIPPEMLPVIEGLLGPMPQQQ